MKQLIDFDFLCCIYVINLVFLSNTQAPCFFPVASPWHLEENRWRLWPGGSSQRHQRRWEFFLTQRSRVKGTMCGHLRPVSLDIHPNACLYFSSVFLPRFSFFESFFCLQTYHRSLTLPLLYVFSHHWAKVVWAAPTSHHSITTPDSNHLAQAMLIYLSEYAWMHEVRCNKVITSVFVSPF